MTPEEWRLAFVAGVATCVVLWVWCFVVARRRRVVSRSASPPRPAGAPPRSHPGVDRAFTWATVARVDLLLDESPSAAAEARFAADMAEAVRRRDQMLTVTSRGPGPRQIPV